MPRFSRPGRSPLKGDRELLRRAFENVIRNAIRYSPDGASIDIRSDVGAQSARVSVRDFGLEYRRNC